MVEYEELLCLSGLVLYKHTGRGEVRGGRGGN